MVMSPNVGAFADACSSYPLGTNRERSDMTHVTGFEKAAGEEAVLVERQIKICGT